MTLEKRSAPANHDSHLFEWLAVATAFLVVNVLSAIFQPPLSFMGGKAWELRVYYDIAYQFRHGLPLTGDAPALYRLGIPWLASVLPFADLAKSFFYINLLANACTALMLVLLLRYFVRSWKLRTALVCLYLIHWLGPTRFLYFVSADTDSAVLFFLTAGFLLVERWRRSESKFDLAMLSLVVLAGVCAREVVLMIPVVFLVAVRPVGEEGLNVRRLFVGVLPLILGSAVFLSIHAFVHPSTTYSFASSALNWAYSKSIPIFVLGFFIALGPVIVLLVLDWKGTRQLLKRNKEVGAFLFLLLVLAYCGGSDTERFLLWGTPVTLILIGSWFERNLSILHLPSLVALIVIMQLISERAFWNTPDLGYSVENSFVFLTSLSSNAYYLSLYSYHSPRGISALMLIEYVAVGTVILSWATFRLIRSTHPASEDPMLAE
jgi:hypothetical protein